MLHKLTLWISDRKGPMGGSKQRWYNRVYQDLHLIGADNSEELAKDRDRYEDC